MSEYNENMSFFNIPAEKWDKFAPYGSGIGSISGFGIFTILIFTLQSPVELLGAFLIPLLSYILCTCTHRKNIFLSKAALAGSIGSIFGGIISGPFVYIFALMWLWPIALLIFVSFNFYIPFYFSRYVCRYEHKSFLEQKG